MALNNGVDQNSYTQTDVGLIDNLQAFVYWSGLEYTPSADSVLGILNEDGSTGGAWEFVMYYGTQGAVGVSDELCAWAVHPGDVAAVPEAQTYAMFLAGLGLVGFMARRRKPAKI